jgi:prevent-host-death family protein
MRTITALEVRAKFGQVLDEAAAGERFIVERAGQPVAAIVPLRDLEPIDPAVVQARRDAAIDDLLRLGRRNRARYGPIDAAAAVREDRDHGHRP